MKLSRALTASLAIALLLPSSLAPIQALAQSMPGDDIFIAKPRSLVDGTRTDRLVGKPNRPDPNCPSGQVFSGGSCVTLNTGAGATILPYAMPSGTYYNAAPYSLLMQVVGPDYCTAAVQVYVSGSWTTVVSSLTTDSNSNCTATGIVPSQTYFWVGDGKTKTRVTALKSGATWAETGVGFYYSTQLSRITYTDYGRDASNCSYDFVTFLWTHNLNGSQYTTSAIENQYCPV